MKIFQTEMNCPAFSCRVNRYDGLCEDKVLPPGGVPLRYIEDSAVPQSTKQGAKYPSAGHRRVQPLLIKPGIYIYDALNRLTEVRNNSNNTLIEGYSYDPLGNRKTKTDGTNIVYYVYDAANQLTQITGNENATLLYDDNGNMYRKTQGPTPMIMKAAGSARPSVRQQRTSSTTAPTSYQNTLTGQPLQLSIHMVPTWMIRS
ncbi:MAG: YD repeat-containing protein [Proteobacteria bacterium]|nr:YD repeat-containing protein [Pseudomonadota bacterium]